MPEIVIKICEHKEVLIKSGPLCEELREWLAKRSSEYLIRKETLFPHHSRFTCRVKILGKKTEIFYAVVWVTPEHFYWLCNSHTVQWLLYIPPSLPVVLNISK